MTKREVEIVNELFSFIDGMFEELNDKGYCYFVRKMMRVWDEFKRRNLMYGTSDALKQENDELREQIDKLERENDELREQIDELERENADLEKKYIENKEMTEWHKICKTNRFPSDRKKVLVIWEDGLVDIAVFRKDYNVFRGAFRCGSVFAWRELPKLPKTRH